MSADQDRIAEALPEFEIGEELGRGAWAVVFRGRRRADGLEVAIKQLPPGFSANPDARGRFVREARVLATLDHPHVVKVIGAVESHGICLLVMDLLPGGSVWDRFASTGLHHDAACAVGLSAAMALQHAHSRGVLHRDIKPDNLMIDASNTVKVTDFGVAKVLVGHGTVHTRAGDVLGTPAYMAPEQARGQEPGPGTDVYALGVVLYELLSGRLPFHDDGAPPLSQLYRRLEESPVPLADVAPTLPPGLPEVVMQCLAEDPAQRWQSAGALALALAHAVTSAYGTGWHERTGFRLVPDGPVLPYLGLAPAPVPPLPDSLPGPSASLLPEEEPQPDPSPTPFWQRSEGPDGQLVGPPPSFVKGEEEQSGPEPETGPPLAPPPPASAPPGAEFTPQADPEAWPPSAPPQLDPPLAESALTPTGVHLPDRESSRASVPPGPAFAPEELPVAAAQDGPLWSGGPSSEPDPSHEADASNDAEPHATFQPTEPEATTWAEPAASTWAEPAASTWAEPAASTWADPAASTWADPVEPEPLAQPLEEAGAFHSAVPESGEFGAASTETEPDTASFASGAAAGPPAAVRADPPAAPSDVDAHPGEEPPDQPDSAPPATGNASVEPAPGQPVDQSSTAEPSPQGHGRRWSARP